MLIKRAGSYWPVGATTFTLAPSTVRAGGVFTNSASESAGPPMRLTASRTTVSAMPAR